MKSAIGMDIFAVDDVGDFWYCNKLNVNLNYHVGICASSISGITIFIPHMLFKEDYIILELLYDN